MGCFDLIHAYEEGTVYENNSVKFIFSPGHFRRYAAHNNARSLEDELPQ